MANNNAPQLERRVFSTRVQVRAANDDGSIPMTGNPILFNVRTELYPGFYEEIAPGAVDEALRRGDDCRLLLNHDPNLVLARTSAGTMTYSANADMVTCNADMAPTSYANDLAISMKRGDISQMSFAFIPDAEEWSYLPNDDILRRITQVQLFDMSVVTYPAYDSTSASLRMATAESFRERVEAMKESRRVYSLDVYSRRLRLRSKAA